MNIMIRIRKSITSLIKYSKLKRDYYNDAKIYTEMLSDSSETSGVFKIDKNKLMPMLFDKNAEAGNLDRHYFIQDLVMARAVNCSAPALHYDIGSRVDGFIAHLLGAGIVKKVIMMDVRPLSLSLDGLDFIQTDATTLDNVEDNSIESLSSLHAIEHFGLGRYGDPVNPDSWRDALIAIQRKICIGGSFYLSVPVGPSNEVYFNAHRIFAPSTIISTLSDLDLVSFKYIHDMKIYDVTNKPAEMYDELVSEYDCGLFIFKKKTKE